MSEAPMTLETGDTEGNPQCRIPGRPNGVGWPGIFAGYFLWFLQHALLLQQAEPLQQSLAWAKAPRVRDTISAMVKANLFMTFS